MGLQCTSKHQPLTYAFWGCVIGCGIGLPFSKLLYDVLISSHFPYAAWSLPGRSLLVILLFVGIAAILAAYAPARRMRNMTVTETINEL